MVQRNRSTVRLKYPYDKCEGLVFCCGEWCFASCFVVSWVPLIHAFLIGCCVYPVVYCFTLRSCCCCLRGSVLLTFPLRVCVLCSLLWRVAGSGRFAGLLYSCTSNLTLIVWVRVASLFCGFVFWLISYFCCSQGQNRMPSPMLLFFKIKSTTHRLASGLFVGGPWSSGNLELLAKLPGKPSREEKFLNCRGNLAVKKGF